MEARRAEAMVRRVLRTADRLGLNEQGRALLQRAFDLGMAPRLALDLDDHHPDYLHPSRTALILMVDGKIADPVILAAALVTDTRDQAFQIDVEALRGIDPAVARLASEIPDPDRAGDTLLESLVAGSFEAAVVAVAERLDHARHLHLRDAGEWSAYHATTCAVYAPLARRTDPVLAGRMEWWCTTFQQRFLGE
jgi:(p)ppGpp synthase/HD superfamily hydrolase